MMLPSIFSLPFSKPLISNRRKQNRSAIVKGAVWLVIVGIECTLIFPAAAQSAGLSNISPTVFGCMRRHTRGAGGWLVYEGENQGRIRVFAAGLGQVAELNYSFNLDQQTLNIAYVQGRAPFDRIRNGLTDTANRCRNGSYR